MSEQTETSEVEQDESKIGLHELFIIHAALVECYNSWIKKKQEGKNELGYTEEQVLNVLRNLYETYMKVDKLIEPQKKMLEELKSKMEQESPQA